MAVETVEFLTCGCTVENKTVHLIRGLALVLWIALGLLAKQQSKPGKLEILGCIWAFSLIAVMMMSEAVRPDFHITTAIWCIAIIMAFYLILPVSTIIKAVAGLILTTSVLVIMFRVQTDFIDPHILHSTIIAYIAANTIGCYSSIHAQSAARQRHFLLMKETILRRDLESSMDQIKTLEGILPICSYCKRIRDDKGYWGQVDKYISSHTDTQFSHSVCPDCMDKEFPNNHK